MQTMDRPIQIVAEDRPIQIVADSAQQLYYDVLEAIQYGEEVASVSDMRSVGSAWGTRDRPTKELRHVSLVLTNPKNRLISAPFVIMEKIIPRAVLMTLSDEKDVDVLAFYDPRAREFSDDGKSVLTNYGYRIRNFDEVDQIKLVIDQLKKDRNTRRAVIHIHSVHDAERRYDPCIDSLHFLIRNERLECYSYWRSENALALLPMNLFEFTLLQELIASELEIPVGAYVQTVTSLHYYLEDEQKLKNTLESETRHASPSPMEPMPHHSLCQVDLIREYESKWRLNPSSAGQYSEKEELSSYWKPMADVIADWIAKKSEQQKASGCYSCRS